MPYTPFGFLGEPMRPAFRTKFKDLTGGTLTAEELIIAGGNNGVIRSQNYVSGDPPVFVDAVAAEGWALFGDGSAEFAGSFEIWDNLYIGGELQMGTTVLSTITANHSGVDDTYMHIKTNTLALYNRSDTQYGSLRAFTYSGFGGGSDLRISSGGVVQLLVGSTTWTFDEETLEAGSGVFNLKTNNGLFSFRQSGASMDTRLHFNADSDTWIGGPSADVIEIVTGGNRGLALGTYFTAPPIYDQTTTGGANVNVNSTGRVWRSTSSLKYKPDWQYVDENVLADLDMPTPIVWEDEVAGTMLGFGTEHIHSMLEAATQDDYENYDVRSLVAILSAKIKRLEAQVEELQRSD